MQSVFVTALTEQNAILKTSLIYSLYVSHINNQLWQSYVTIQTLNILVSSDLLVFMKGFPMLRK